MKSSDIIYLEAYEESGSDLMKWFLKKYQEQNKGNL